MFQFLIFYDKENEFFRRDLGWMVFLQKGIFIIFVFYFVSLECVGILVGVDIFRWVLMGLFGIRWLYVVGVQQYLIVGCEGGVFSFCVFNYVFFKLLFYYGRLDISWVK